MQLCCIFYCPQDVRSLVRYNVVITSNYNKMATKKETLVNFILDKSGSMASVKGATISGFNEYLGTLKNDGNKYSFSLTLFDTVIDKVCVNKPIKDVKDIDADTYMPDGGTALYDAVCITIDAVLAKVKPTQKVLTVIMTDGEENSSKEYGQEQLKAKIKELESKGNWSFVFLGANQDAWANAQKMGMSQMNTANFVGSAAGIQHTMRAMSANTANFSASLASNTANFFSAADQADLSSGGAGINTSSSSSGASGVDQQAISQHFSNLGKKSWDKRKRDFLK